MYLVEIFFLRAKKKDNMRLSVSMGVFRISVVTRWLLCSVEIECPARNVQLPYMGDKEPVCKRKLT